MLNTATFTATQIAEALGMPRPTVHRALDGMQPSGTRLVANNPAAVWSIADLPQEIRARVAALQRARGHITAEQICSKEASAWWKPALPLHCVHSEDLADARKLQTALGRALALADSVAMKAREELAAPDYAAAFGRAVSDRYLRKLIGRTLDRDGGRRQFDRLDLYLPESPRAASAIRGTLEGRIEFEALETHFKGCADRGNPSASEIAYCWRGVVSFWQVQVADGRDARTLREPLLEWLENTLPRLGKTRAAMSRNLDRKLAADTLLDRRAERSGHRRRAPEWEENIELLAKLARKWGGRIAQAWRALFVGEAPDGWRFTKGFRSYFSSYNPRLEKSRVSTSVLAAVRAMMAATEALAQGPKAARKSGPRNSRDWSGVMAGDAYTCDDVTQNHYFYRYCEEGDYEFDGQRFNVTRGQFLPVICEGTDYPLGFALIPRRSYNSRDILTLMARICMNPEIGLPHRRVVFERGVWKALKLANALVGWQERVSTGFEREGRELRMHHATSAGAKVIENYIGRLQNTMQHLPGYAGRDEQRDCPESTKAALARLKAFGQPLKAEFDPAKAFLSHTQLAQEIEAAMNRLKREPMKGERHDGTSPEDEWKRRHRQAHAVLPDSLRHLLFTETTDATVRPDGLRIRIGGTDAEYCDSRELGALIGEKVRVRFNPELPETVTVSHLRSDPQELHPFAVPLKQRLSAHDATPEQFAEARRQRRTFLAHGETIFRTMRPSFNATICNTSRIAPEVLASGEAHREIEREVIELRQERTRHGKELRQTGERIGLELDPAKSRTPSADLGLARKVEELEARIRRQEASATTESEAADL